MAAEKRAIPVLVLKEGTQRTRGREALFNNIQAAKILGEIMRTSLGPRGLDKMLVDQFGDIVITNDGATILDEIDIVHPAAKFIAKISKSVDIEVGDGTTSAVVLAGELLREAEELLKEDIHPTIIIDGYMKGLEKALEVLERIAIPVDTKNDEEVKKIAKTCLSGKIVRDVADHFVNIALEAIKRVMRYENGKLRIPLGDIKIEKREGGALTDTQLIDGIVLDKEVVHHRMPRVVKDAKIALIAYSLELEKPEYADVNVMMTSDRIDELLRWEHEKLKEMAEKIIKTGANVVICQKGIDDVVQHYFAKAGILAVRRVKKSDMEKIAKATGAKIIMNDSFLGPDKLGYAKIVEERKVGDENMIFIRGCKNPRAVTILVRGGTKMLVEEAERALNDVLNVIRNIYLEPKVVPAGGAPEIAVAVELRKYAKQLGGKESKVIEAFANAFERVATALIESGGLDVIETLAELRAHHARGEHGYGINLFTLKVEDLTKSGIFDPIRVRKTVYKAAVESSCMILRIDDIIAAKSAFEEKGEEAKTPESSEEE